MSLEGQDMKSCGEVPCNDWEKRGPSVTFTWDEPYDLPDDGEMTVKFKVRKREEEINDKKKVYEVRIELLEITKVKSGGPAAPASGESETGSILDSLRDKMGE
jgi:hypothetical protein